MKEWEAQEEEANEWMKDIIAEADYLADIKYENYLKSINKTQIQIFNENMQNIEEIMSSSVSDKAFESLIIMLYGHIIASVEAYLYFTFIDSINSSELFLRKLFETDEGLAKNQLG